MKSTVLTVAPGVVVNQEKKTKRNSKMLQKPHIQNYTNSTHSHHSACIFSGMWLSPNIAIISDVRLMLVSCVFLTVAATTYLMYSVSVAASSSQCCMVTVNALFNTSPLFPFFIYTPMDMDSRIW